MTAIATAALRHLPHVAIPNKPYALIWQSYAYLLRSQCAGHHWGTRNAGPSHPCGDMSIAVSTDNLAWGAANYAILDWHCMAEKPEVDVPGGYAWRVLCTSSACLCPSSDQPIHLLMPSRCVLTLHTDLSWELTQLLSKTRANETHVARPPSSRTGTLLQRRLLLLGSCALHSLRSTPDPCRTAYKISQFNQRVMTKQRRRTRGRWT